MMSLDGTCLDVADTPENEAAFGRPGSSRRAGGGAFPQLRLVALAESGTHAICDAALGPYASSEKELADQLLGGLTEGMLCLADRGIYSFERFQRARQTGAHKATPRPSGVAASASSPAGPTGFALNRIRTRRGIGSGRSERPTSPRCTGGRSSTTCR